MCIQIKKEDHYSGDQQMLNEHVIYSCIVYILYCASNFWSRSATKYRPLQINPFFNTLKVNFTKKFFFPDCCAESYLLIKTGIRSDASVKITPNLEVEGFVTYLMQSNQKAEVALESSWHFSVWTHRKSEWRSQSVAVIFAELTDSLVHAKMHT